MKSSRKRNRRACSGFSLIEVLVATLILLVIVVLASLVFQQMTGAYQTGERKIDSQVVLRNVIGAVTRDLALAVDPAEYPGLEGIMFIPDEGRTISFLALTGMPSADDGADVVRTLEVITYSYAGRVVTRTEQATTIRDGRWQVTGEQISADLNDNRQNPISEFKFHTEGGHGVGQLPDRIGIHAEIQTADTIARVAVGSYGRNGVDGDSDDIWVGYRPVRKE